MKKCIKTILVVHMLMMTTFICSGYLSLVVQEALVFGGSQTIAALVGGTWAAGILQPEGTSEWATFVAGNAAVDLYGAMLIPFVGPALIALEYFDVTDFVDWF